MSENQTAPDKDSPPGEYVTFVPGNLLDLKSLKNLSRQLDVSVWTVRRWATHGVMGVKLRVFRGPHGLATTDEEYRQFLQSINQVGLHRDKRTGPPAKSSRSRDTT